MLGARKAVERTRRFTGKRNHVWWWWGHSNNSPQALSCTFLQGRVRIWLCLNQVLQRIRMVMGRDEVGCWRAMPFQKEEEHEPVHRGRKSLGGECAGEALRVQFGWQV